jgi:hypothetical protein
MDETKSFAQMLDETDLTPKRFSVGEKVEATIVKISPEWIFIDLGVKSEGYLDKKEFLDEAGNLTAKEGDTITAYFLSSQHSERLFTTKLQANKNADEYLLKIRSRSKLQSKRKLKEASPSKSAQASAAFAPSPKWIQKRLMMYPPMSVKNSISLLLNMEKTDVRLCSPAALSWKR